MRINSRTWLNIALLILVIASAVLANYLPGLNEPAPPPALTALKRDQVTRIAIERPAQPPLKFSKEKGGWVMTAPLQVAANEFRIESLLDITETPSHGQFPSTGQDLAKFKLDKSPVRVRLNDTQIAFGDSEPLNQRRYVALGTAIHVIDDLDFQSLSAPPATWVSMFLLPRDAKLTELILPDLKLIRNKQDDWSLSPASTSISADALNAFIDEWRHAQALDVKPYVEGPTQGSVQIQLARQSQPLRFTIMARKPDLILARPELGVQYHLSAESGERLLQLAASPGTAPLPPSVQKPSAGDQHEHDDHTH